MQCSSFEYLPRKPEETVLYRVVAEQLETFLSRQQDRERPAPKFVEQEFRSFLECGIPSYGFVRVLKVMFLSPRRIGKPSSEHDVARACSSSVSWKSNRAAASRASRIRSI